MPTKFAALTKKLPDALFAPIGFGPPALPATALDAEAGPHAFAGGDFVTVTVTLAELEDGFVATTGIVPATAWLTKAPAICAEFAPLDDFLFPAGGSDDPITADVPLALVLSGATEGLASSSVRVSALTEF